MAKPPTPLPPPRTFSQLFKPPTFETQLFSLFEKRTWIHFETRTSQVNCVAVVTPHNTSHGSQSTDSSLVLISSDIRPFSSENLFKKSSNLKEFKFRAMPFSTMIRKMEKEKDFLAK
jgi:hypothetical protein